MKITCHVFASVFFLLSGLHQSQAAIVSWVGGSGDWNTATNWSSGVVPRSTNDVVIDRPGELTITHSSGSHTVRSIQCQESFLLSGGLLSVTNGSSSASGEFRVSGGAVLAVAGPATSFSAPNATNIDGGGLSVSGGAVLSLPEIRSYRKFNTECNATWLATGAGSVIDLPGLTNLTGFQCSILGGVGIQALAGGRILLTNLTTIPDGRVGVLADGTNSLVDLSRLNDYQQTNLVLTLEARSGGSILVPNFVDGGQVALVLKPGGSISTAQFRKLLGVTLESGVTLTLPGVTNIDGANFTVSGGAFLSLPNVSRYRQNSTECNATWLATGTGSTIEFSGLTNLTGFQCSILGGVNIQALAGGRILLTNLTVIPDGRVGVLADGTNSLVDLSRLNDYQQTNLVLTLEARSGGRILVSSFVDGGQVALVLKPGGNITTAQFQRLLGVTLTSGVSLVLPGVSNINGANLTVSGGAFLSLPGVSRYRQNSTECGATWQATGEGSIIDLPGLTNLTGFQCSILGGVSIQALAGGRILLTNLVVIPDGRVGVLADGTNSLVDLSRLNDYEQTNLVLTLEARSGGSILVPNFIDGGQVALVLKPGGSISTAQFRRLIGVTLESGVTLTLPGVTNIDGANFTVSGGAMLSLPGVSRYRQNSTECGATWLASGEGSIIDLPGLTNLTGFNCSILGGVSIQALAGAHVLLTNLAVIPDGPVSVLADGFNSLVDLSAMTGHPGVNFSLSLEARNGGSICVPRLVDGNHVTLTLKAGGFISTTQFRRLYGVTLESGVTLTLPAVTNINGGGLNVSGGAVLSLPGVRSFQKTGTECGATWQATGAGSVIDLPGLISLKGFSCSILGGVKIQANSGGFVNLRNLVTVSNNYVSVLADGADSLIDLSGLLNFPEPPSFSLTNRSGGIVDVSGAMASIPLEPLLLSPPNNSANATLIVRLEWQAASNVVAFEYELAQNNAVIVQGSGLSGVTVPLPAHGIYQWRVRGKTAHRFSPWSQTWTFDTLPGIGVPTLLAPDEQAAQVPVFASLQWSPVAGAVAYDYELTRGSLSQTASVRGTENTAVRLLPDTAYAWRVRAKSLYRQGNWSPARAFRTVSTNGAALALSLIPPAQPGSGIIRLNWPAIPGNTYWLQYKHVLEDPVWTDVQQVVPAGDRLTADALVGTNDTAFFRVVQRDGLHLLSATADQDHDRMEDGWERANGLNPADPSDANTDLDHDGLTNLDEFELGSSPNVADNAGSLPGQFAVASGGAATYEIPIAVPPGTAGMIPKLALTYNSRSGNGLLGMGWSLSGLSAITRCAPTLQQDGKRAAVEFDGDDRFCLDGQRLIAVSGTNGANGTQYRTEIDTFTKVVSFGTNGSGPAYFKAWSKGGQMLEYGLAEDARVEAQGKTTIMVWLLNRITDTSGNYLSFHYTKNPSSGEYMPARIEYTGNDAAGVLPYAAVLFNYESRPDVSISYQAGSAVRGNYRLHNIETYAEGALVHRYSVAYEQGLSTGRSRVKSITLSDAEGRSLSPTVCAAWTDASQRGRFSVRPAFMPPGYDVSTNNFLYETADYNGDGAADLLHFAGPRGVRLWLSKRDGTFDIKPSFPDNGYAVDANGYKFLSGDFDGDTKADLIHLTDSGHARVWLSRGDGTFDIKPEFSPAGYDISANGYNFRAGDFNGDGRTDLMHLVGPNAVQIWFSNGDGTFFITDAWNPGDSMSASGYKVFIMDANGDGRSDALHFAGSRFLKAWLSEGDGTFRVTSRFPAQDTYDVSANGYSYSSGDFNGDGKTDLIHFVDENTVRIWLNKGDGTFDIRGELKPSGYTVTHNAFNLQREPSSIVLRHVAQFVSNSPDPVPPDPCPVHQFRLGDFNGDGKTDFIDVAGPNQLTVWTSNGDGTFTIEPSFSQTDYDATVFASALLVGNFASDAKTDLIQLVADNSAHVWQASGPLPDLLTVVVDGYGHSNRVTYKPLTDATVYQKDTGTVYPQFDLQGPLYVVAEHVMGDGIGGEAANRYTYGGAKTDVTNGFLGFRWQKSVEERTGVQNYTESRQDYPHIGSLSFSETRLANNTLISRATNNYGVVSSFSNRVIFPFVSRSVVETFELDGNFVSRITTTNLFDIYGNPIVVDVAADDGFRKFTQSTYTNDTNRWILSKLTRAEVTAYAPGQPAQTRVSSFEYEPADGLIRREIVEPDSPLTQITDYTRDPFGNVTVTAMSGPDVAPRIQRTTIDASGRFPIAVENALGHRETRQYDSRFGNLIAQTGPNNLTTRWTHDGFGRKRMETRPDGVTTRILYALPDSHAPPLARHRVLTKTTGTAPTAAYFDELGREIRKLAFGFDGRAIYQDTAFNAKGWVDRASRPYFAGDPTYWTTVTYDAIGRKLVETDPDTSQTRMEYHGLTTIAFNELSQRRTTVRNSQNWLVSATDDSGNAVSHSYDSFGNLTRTVDPAGNAIAMIYDLRGRKTAMDDPDTGHSEIRYNAFSEVVWRMDGKGQTFTTEYDILGRVKRELLPEGAITYAFDSAANGIGKLANVTSYNGYRRSHNYDGLSRPETVTTSFRGESFSLRNQYDALSRVERIQYPTGFAVRQVYNERGYLAELRKSSDDSLLWRSEEINAQGQMVRQRMGNGVTTTREYDPADSLVRNIRSGVNQGTEVQNLGFMFDFLGNLTSRSDNTRGLSEAFLYDNLNRLTLAEIPGRAAKSYQYDSLGNISFKSDVGAYAYDRIAAGPHAVTRAGNMLGRYSYDANGNMTGGNGRSFNYFSFNKPAAIVGASARSEFTYDSEHSRLTHTATVGGATNTTLYIGGLYERVTAQTGVKHRHFITTGSGVVAIYTSEASTPASTRYVHKDHLGSIESLTDESGHVVERFAYDPHGKRRGENWEDIPSGTRTSSFTERGFGGHVQLDSLELVHMGGRMYDPVLGRFTSADPFVQSMEDLQALNRYSYVLNNPLSMTDPSGFWGNPFKAIGKAFKNVVHAISKYGRQIVAIAAAAAITAASAGTLGPVMASALGGFTSGFISSKGDLRSAIYGAVTALAFNIVGGSLPETSPGELLFKSAIHGVVGGVSSVVQGGSFIHGFTSAAVTKAFSSDIDYFINGEGVDAVAGRIVASSTIGGVASKLSGGRFSDGAMTGAFSRLFNDELDRLTHAQERGLQGAVAGGILATGTSLVLDYGSAGLNIFASPAEIAFGVRIGYQIGYIFGSVEDLISGGHVFQSKYPPGYWPADKGSREWGRRNGVGADVGGERFHDLKGGTKGARPNDDFGVNPQTGDVVDSTGENIGNLGE